MKKAKLKRPVIHEGLPPDRGGETQDHTSEMMNASSKHPLKRTRR